MKWALGADFGGTSLKLARVDELGQIVAREQVPSEAIGSPSDWIGIVARTLDAWSRPEGAGAPCGIGVGVPGFVDFERGFIHELTNIEGWVGVPLVRLLEERFRIPARVDNDANAMAVGEMRFGIGKGYRHAVFVTLGTGVGGALLVDGRLYRGAHSMAGEIGHLSIDWQGPASPQGRGTLERYVGNRQLTERALRRIASGAAPSLARRAGGDPGGITPRWLAEAAMEGDPDAIAIFDEAADCLAAAFATLTYTLQPEVFIVGGGVAQSGEILFEPLRRHLRERLSPCFAERVEIRPARLGADAGVIGAAALVLPGA
jgi:glucokinase